MLPKLTGTKKELARTIVGDEAYRQSLRRTIQLIEFFHTYDARPDFYNRNEIDKILMKSEPLLGRADYELSVRDAIRTFLKSRDALDSIIEEIDSLDEDVYDAQKEADEKKFDQQDREWQDREWEAKHGKA